MPMAISMKSVPILTKYSIIKSMEEERPKLLVVDDEPDQYNYIKSYFSKRNFTVFTAESGEQALTLIKNKKPDLVLLDMKIAGNMNGRDVLRELREYDKNTKVAIITGDILDEQRMQEIYDLGIVDFISKPADLLTLENVIKKVLESSYPKAVRFEPIKPKEYATDVSLRRLSHDLSNITSDIANKCELFILDTEEGLNKEKSEKERLDEATNILRAVLKQTERLTDIINKLSSRAKKEL